MLHSVLCLGLLVSSARSWAVSQDAAPTPAAESRAVHVATTDELRRALTSATPGTTVFVAAGEYEGFSVRDVTGESRRPIRIVGADPKQPPVFRGQIQLSDVAWLVLEHVVVEGAPHNGVNIDDAGTFDTPSHHVALRRVVVRDCGGRGNDDGIKLSGLDDFRLEECTVERWGRAGSAVDMVGCHRGRIVGCTFRDRPEGGAATGVQTKGGTRDVEIRSCRFEDAGERAVHLGGSTALAYFRPKPESFEAKDVVVEGCTFVGSTAPIAFTGVDGATVRFNTFVRPRKWFARILQETREPGFVPCRNGRFTDNLVVYRAADVSVPVNVGDATAPETFVFARNYWHCEDDAARAAPRLPTPETDAVVGGDPRFVDAEHGDYRLDARSPALAHGAGALPKSDK